MYKSFKVRNFRGFCELTIDNLRRINLIAGANNVGKTALLEAFFLHAGAYNPELAFRVNAFRGVESFKIELERWSGTPWDSLFYRFDTSEPIELEGNDVATGYRLLRLKVLHEPSDLVKVVQPAYQWTAGREVPQSIPSTLEPAKVLELEYQRGEQKGSYYVVLSQRGILYEPLPPPPPFPTFFLGTRLHMSPKEGAELFGRLETFGKQDHILRVLQLIEPRLKRLAVIVTGDEPVLHGDIGAGRLMPLPLMGGGMVRLASLVLYIGNASGGVVLVDEFENGLHHSVLLKVWQAIGQVAREFNTQVIATTHSFECIVAAHRAFSEAGDYDFRLYRLEQGHEKINVVSYNREDLEAAIEIGLEVR